MKYTEQQIETARQTDMIDFLSLHEGFSFKRKGRNYSCVEHDSLVILADRSGWYWNSQGKGGGTAIDYCQKIKGMSFPEALQTLVGNADETKKVYKRTEISKQKPSEKAVFVLPETGGNKKCDRVFAYLNKTRKIDNCIIDFLVHEKKLYQDNRGNCVFVGFDESNTARYAAIRGTLSEVQYRGEVESSDKRYSFSIDGKNKTKLYIFESPIDLLSHATLANKVIGYNKAWTVHNRLSLGGLADVALEHYLSTHPDVKELNLCLDNDDKGIQKSNAYAEKYRVRGYTVNVILPNAKDYNADLVNFQQKKEKQQISKPPPAYHR